MPVFLQELFTVKEASEDVLPIKESEEEHLSMDSRWEGSSDVGMYGY